MIDLKVIPTHIFLFCIFLFPFLRKWKFYHFVFAFNISLWRKWKFFNLYLLAIFPFRESESFLLSKWYPDLYFSWHISLLRKWTFLFYKWYSNWFFSWHISMLGKWKFYNFQVIQINFLFAYFPFEKVKVFQFLNDI